MVLIIETFNNDTHDFFGSGFTIAIGLFLLNTRRERRGAKTSRGGNPSNTSSAPSVRALLL
jgi:hypothetical protein